MSVHNKICFISHNRFGFACLKALFEMGIPVETVYTLDAEKRAAVSDGLDFVEGCRPFGVRVEQIRQINQHADDLIAAKYDLVFVFGWSQIIHAKILDAYRGKIVGSHPSLLPRNRGRAAIPWHFINREKEGGVTFFYMEEGCDSGDMIGQQRFPLTDQDNAKTYYDKLLTLGPALLCERIHALLDGTLLPQKQDSQKANYLLIRTPEDAYVDFLRWNTEELFNVIRSVAYVYPTAYLHYEGKKINVFRSRPVPKEQDCHSATLGQIVALIDASVWVKTIDGILELSEMTDDNNQSIEPRDVFKVGHHFNR